MELLMTYAKGKYSKFISDRSGLEYPYSEMVTEWTGMKVHTSEYEPKAPQLMPHEHSPDPIALKDPRPDRTENNVERLLGLNPFIQDAGTVVVKVFEPGHNRTTNDTVRFRNAVGPNSSTINADAGKTITVIDNDFYSFGLGGVAPTEKVISGGGIASAGPVTITP
tara:strand:+ start:2529 stop:3026 length:498 start_codon:yes stop_codon:yes gene_type:complete